MKHVAWWAVAAALAGLGVAAGAHAQQATRVTAKARTSSPAEVEERWRASLEGFAAQDKLTAPLPGGVLFVGSSSIRLWNDMESAFQSTAIIKRGFGGSLMRDCTRYVEQLVLPYRPRLVVVYAGDNDLAEGRTPADVLASYTEFVERVREALPDTRIAYLSIKPSPLRAALMPLAQRTNQLIATYSAQAANLDFIDVYSKMLDAEGRPRRELFLADALHLNPQGYAIWRSVIAQHLTVPDTPSSAVTARVP
jgi:lysophospholipase L1-like esterase